MIEMKEIQQPYITMPEDGDSVSALQAIADGARPSIEWQSDGENQTNNESYTGAQRARSRRQPAMSTQSELMTTQQFWPD